MYLLVISTWACNLRCSYCRTEKKNVYISEKTLKKAVDLLLTSQQDELLFEFFGGEPLMLPFPVMKRAILYGNRRALRQNKRIQFIITTNGILLNREKIRFFKRHNTMLIISLDGQARAHNINRPQIDNKDSYALVVKNLPLVFKEGLDCFCYTVITPETVQDLKKSFTSLLKLGFKKIWIMMACGPRWEKDKILALRRGLEDIARIYPALLAEKGVVLLNPKNWLSPLRFNTELSVNIDGFIYSACLTYLIKDEKVRRRYVIGHIDRLTEAIDTLDQRRLPNEKAIEVIYRENNLMDRLKNNMYVGRIFAKFSLDLQKDLQSKGLWTLYQSLASWST